MPTYQLLSKYPFTLVWTIFFLQVSFDLKHFIADYPLQTPWMLGKFKKQGWVLPLSAHCAVHSLGTILVLGAGRVFILIPWAAILVLSVFDFVIHFIMDRIKASPDLLGRFETVTKSEMKDINSRKDNLTIEDKRKLKSNWLFWLTLGVDQTVHHLTHDLIWFSAIVWTMLSSFTGVNQ
jgi:hypothetical protein